MYKCSNCGEIFEEPNSIKEDWGETFYVCPYCDDDYEEAHQCKECEEWHTEDELYDGWCEKCLRETINYDTFFEYCEANKDEHYLDMFVLTEFLGSMDVPKDITDEFHQVMVYEYKMKQNVAEFAENTMQTKQFSFLDACIRFIMDDDGEIGRENYADWLNSKKEVK